MFCDRNYPDGRIFEKNSRAFLEKAVADADKMGIRVKFGSEYEFYLFKTDENGEPTKIPFDNAGYMDVAPDDKGENVRREICLTLVDMDIQPECSHHEEGPGQNEIDFRYSDAMTAADNAMNFITVVKATATHNGLCGRIFPRSLSKTNPATDCTSVIFPSPPTTELTTAAALSAGIMAHIREMSIILNPTKESYNRLGKLKAPKYITWSEENRSQLIEESRRQAESLRGLSFVHQILPQIPTSPTPY